MARITKTVEYLRHDFTEPERLTMGNELAQTYSQLDQIDNEEAVIKAQIKERKAGVQQKIGTLSRNISAGFEMQNVSCRTEYDKPNVGEVSYFREDTGEFVKARPMSESERQQEIPFDTPIAVNPQKPEETAAAVETFFAAPEEPEVEHARREPLVTMGDAKKKRKPGNLPIIREVPDDNEPQPVA